MPENGILKFQQITFSDYDPIYLPAIFAGGIGTTGIPEPPSYTLHHSNLQQIFQTFHQTVCNSSVRLDRDLFCEDVKGIKDINNNDNDDDYVDKVMVKDRNNYDENDDNDNKSISALRLDKDLVFSQGHHGYQ